ARQQQLTPATVSFTASLRQFTDQLAAHDADLRSLLNQGTPGLNEIDATLNDIQPNLPLLLHNLSVTGDVLHTYLPQLQQTLVVYPLTVARGKQILNPADGDGVQLDMRVGVNNPPSCVNGYLPVSARRSPSDIRQRAVNPLAHCTSSPQDPTAVRGARNLPCPNSPARGPLPISCGLVFGAGQWPAGYNPGATSINPTGAKAVAAETNVAPSTGWQTLFLQPLGLA